MTSSEPSGERTEAALRARERELSQLVDMVPSHLWRLSRDGEPLFFNKRMVDFLGFDIGGTKEPSRLQQLLEAIHPEDVEEFETALSTSLGNGQAFAMRYRLRRADGVYHWMSSRAEPLHDDSGHIVQWYGLCHDIEAQMQAQEALRVSQQQLQRMIDAVPIRIWRASSTDGPIYLNKRYLDHFRSVIADFDLRGDPSIGDLLKELVHPEDAAGVERDLKQCFEGGEGAALRFRWREKDGAYRWAQCHVEPRRDNDGSIAEWYGVSLDIDDEVRSQETLRERERELSLLVDMAPVYIGRMAPDGTPTFFSKRTAQAIGLDYLGAWDKPGIDRLATMIAGAVHPEDGPPMQAVLLRALSTGEPYTIRYRQRNAGGDYRWMEGRADPLRDADGRIVQWYAIAIDIEDQVQTQDALRRASAKLAQATRNASLAELSASIAHEVNQPLAAIVANSHACQRWLTADPPNLARAKGTIENITRDANSAAEVVSRIRALFRHSPAARVKENVNCLIMEVRGLMADEIALKNVRVEMDLATDLPSTSLDRVQI